VRQSRKGAGASTLPTASPSGRKTLLLRGRKGIWRSPLPEKGMSSWHCPMEGHGGIVPWRLSPWGFRHTPPTSVQT